MTSKRIEQNTRACLQKYFKFRQCFITVQYSVANNEGVHSSYSRKNILDVSWKLILWWSILGVRNNNWFDIIYDCATVYQARWKRNELRHKKIMQTVKTQISLHVCADWSEDSLFVSEIYQTEEVCTIKK